MLKRYRRTGADLPFGNPLAAHGVDMEGYFWRFTEPDSGQVIIALIGVNRSPKGTWATVALADLATGFLRVDAHDVARADPRRLGASAGFAFNGTADHVIVDLGPDARLDVRLSEHNLWPRAMFGGSSYFHSVPGLNQYWHPWLLGGSATGTVQLGDKTFNLAGAQVYGEKNWGREGFPDSWWWGQAQGFRERRACVAFAGGEVYAGPLKTEVTALVVRLPDGGLLRLGNPVTSPVKAKVTDTTWDLSGQGMGWNVTVHGEAPLGAAHVLPVPLPSERRNVAGAIEHLGGELEVRVERFGRHVWSGHSKLAGLEHGGLLRAAAELVRRGAQSDSVGHPPMAGANS